MKSMIGTLLLVSLFVMGQAQWAWGPCPDIEPMQNFNPASYMGVWWVALNQKDAPFKSSECGRAEYILNQDGTFKIINSGTRDSKWSSVFGEAYCDKSGDAVTGACHVTVPEFSFKGPYTVLDTDYNNYSVVYGCTNYYLFHTIYAALFEREPGDINPSEYVKYYQKEGLTMQDFSLVANEDCPPFPNKWN